MLSNFTTDSQTFKLCGDQTWQPGKADSWQNRLSRLEIGLGR